MLFPRIRAAPIFSVVADDRRFVSLYKAHCRERRGRPGAPLWP
jgi:hypothetical protein